MDDYQANAQGEDSALLAAHTLYTELGYDTEERRIAYRGLFHEQLDPGTIEEIRAATNGNFALGSSRFQAQVAATLGRRVSPDKSGWPRKKNEPESLHRFGEERQSWNRGPSPISPRLLDRLRNDGARIVVQVNTFSGRNYALELPPDLLGRYATLGIGIARDVYPYAQNW